MLLTSWSFHLFLLLSINSVIGSAMLIEDDKDSNNYTAVIGDYVVFNCHLDFPHEIPIPYILHWNHEGQTIFSSYEVPGDEREITVTDDYTGRIHLFEGRISQEYGQGSINLTNIREADRGWYECKVIFPDRSPSSRNNGTWFYLNIEGENILAIPPINKTAMDGDTVDLTCRPKDSTVTVSWLRDGVEISQLEDLRNRATITDNGSLRIKPVAVGDLGEYTCVVTDFVGDQQSASAFLNVQYKAKVIYAPKEVYLPYGKPALLDCHFRANPPLTNLRWEKDGFLFDPYNVPGVFYRRNGSLYFSKVDETHSGTYSCTPYNELGTEGPSPTISVIVQRPPVFTVTPQRLYMRKLGENLEIPCDAKDGDQTQQPTIVWFKKDGSPLSQDRILLTGGNLTIERIQEQDRGIYQCAASNEAATIVADAELMVLNVPPRAPYNLNANSSSNAITLTWVPGYVRPKMEYAVWYRPTDTTEWKTMKIPSKKITEATIMNLSPGKEYEFMVLSQDKHGDGMFSKAIKVLLPTNAGFTKNIINTKSASEFRSSQEVEQTTPPRNIRIQVTAEGYLVTWDAPVNGKDNIKLYIVRWFRDETNEQHLHGRAETTDLFYLVKSLEEESNYIFEISALTHTDEIVTSEQFKLEVPAYRKNRAISMGVVAGVAFLAAALAVIWWARRRFCRPSLNK